MRKFLVVALLILIAAAALRVASWMGEREYQRIHTAAQATEVIR